MTDRRSTRRRWSKNSVRFLAWLTGGLTFMAGGAILATTPTPIAVAVQPRPLSPARRVIERHITRKIIIVDPPVSSGGVVSQPISGGGWASSPGSTSTGSSGSSGGGAVSPPTTTTSGS